MGRRARDRDLVEGARSIAEDMLLPNGRQARLARIIDAHLWWFEAARRRGCAWDDIIEMLYAAGVKRPDGRALSRGHVSSLVWRKSKECAAASAGAPGTDHRLSSSIPASAPDMREFVQAVAKRSTSNAVPEPGDFRSDPPASADVGSAGPAARRGDGSVDTPAASTLAFMRHAARIRRNAEG
jgi:hypothetical protein